MTRHAHCLLPLTSPSIAPYLPYCPYSAYCPLLTYCPSPRLLYRYSKARFPSVRCLGADKVLKRVLSSEDAGAWVSDVVSHDSLLEVRG